MPSMSSGLVSSLTRTTFCFCFPRRTASSAVNTIVPAAAPGEAAIPFPTTLFLSAALSAAASNVGCKSISRVFASICMSASFSVIMPSSMRSQAILIAAAAVLFPFLV